MINPSSVLAAMLAWAPPASDRDVPRYAAIAADIAAVADDPAEPPALPGEDGRTRTAFLLASIAAEESGGFRADVDDGRARGKLGEVCVMQILVAGKRTWEGWTADDLARDRTACIRAGLHRVRESIGMCRALTSGDQLGAYTHGKCIAGNTMARRRWRRALAFAAKVGKS